MWKSNLFIVYKRLTGDDGIKNEQIYISTPKLDEKLSIETRTWENFRGKKEPNPFTDARYLVKLIEFSIDNVNHVPKLSHFKNIKNEFSKLLVN